MCGVYGQFSSSGICLDKAKKRIGKLSYRGPDHQGVWSNTEKTACLGHRRLSIIGLSAANDQPFVSRCGQYTIVYNGEVYNYKELKSELESLGYEFRSEGDTEVVLASFITWGESCLIKFNGMFAFGVYFNGSESAPRYLFLARDRMGKKPLYYRHDSAGFEFASELKSLDDLEPDLGSINHYLAMGYVPNELSIASGVKKLNPGACATYNIDKRALSIRKYWELPKYSQAHEGEVSIEQHSEQCWALLKDAVSIRLRSDVPIGVFLSGGLDSSLITAAASEVSSETVNTFTVAMRGSKLDESRYAREISDYFGTEHNVLNIADPDPQVIEDITPFIDEPLADSSIIPSFLICKLTRDYATVALGGDGGDEVFGGYRHYQRVLRNGYLDSRFLRPILKTAGGCASLFPAGLRGRNKVSSLINGGSFEHVMGTPYFDQGLRKRIFTSFAQSELGEQLCAPEERQLSFYRKGSTAVDSLMRMDFSCVLPDDYLVKVDRASMYNSLEVRAPMLDYRMVEYCYSRIAPALKVSSSETRRIQNQMARSHLPSNYELNRKQGFSIPMEYWLKNIDLFSYFERLPSDLFDMREMESLVCGQEKGRTNSARLFALLMLGACFENIFT